MKRLWVILTLFVLAFIWAVTSVAQKMTSSPEDHDPVQQYKRRMQLREEMHRRIREKLLLGQGPDTDLFEGMDQMFQDAFKDLDSFGGPITNTQSSHFEAIWSEDQSGRILILTPKSKDQQLNIDVNAQMITIKGKTEQRSEAGTLMSSFTNSFSVPPDCDGTKVKMEHKDGKIVIRLPYRTGKGIIPKTPQQEDRSPLPPSSDEVTI